MGIISLSEIFDLSDHWIRSSINGYNSRAAGNLLSGFERQNFIVLVNGQHADLSFLDEQNLDLLPFTVDQIDTVIFVNVPVNYEDYYATNGLIEFKLKKPTQGFSINAMQSLGNQVGDPGPYAYTQYRTPNIDKLGYIAGLNVKTSGSDWNLLVNLKYNENFVTDYAIEDRIKLLTDNQKAILLGTSTKLNFKLLGGMHDVFFAFSQDDNFFYFPPYGNEIPSRRIFRHLGFNGFFPLSDKVKFAYSVVKGINELARVENNRDLNFNIAVTTTSIKLASIYSTKKLTSSFGIKYSKHDANRSGLFNDEQINLTSLNMNSTYNLSRYSALSAGFELVKNSGKSYNKYYISSKYSFNGNHSIFLHSAFSETALNEELNYFTWTRNEVPLLTGTAIENFNLSPNKPKKIFSTDFKYTFRLSKNTEFSAACLFRDFQDYYIENYNYNLSGTGSMLIPNNNIENDQNLKIAGVYTDIKLLISQRLKTKFYYQYQQSLNSSDNFSKQWDKIPKHTASVKLEYDPVNTFKIWTKLSYISKTIWREFEYITYQSNFFYNYQLNEKILLDFSIQKSFWRNRLWINLLFKNIFNQQDKLNPIGINQGLRFYLITQLKLESLLN